MPTFVKEILDQKGRAVVTVEPGENIGAIAKILHQNRIGGVVISDSSQKILGIFTERDLVRAIAQHGEDAMSRAVGETMTRDVISCREDSTTDQLMAIMTGGRFRHVPVEADGKLVGIISIGDVVKARIREVENEANEIKAYIAG
jgi:CBS domain-containing protein